MKALIDGKINLSDTKSHTMNNNIEKEFQKNPMPPPPGEQTAFANRREEKIKLRGGLNKYNRVSELYRLSSENSADINIKKELVWEEYVGVRTVIYGTDQTTIFLSSLSEKAKQEEIDRLYNFIFEGHEEQIYLFEKLTKEVFHINVSIAEGKQKLDTQEKKDVACSQLIAKIPISLWKKKDFSLLFIEPEENKNQLATAGSTEIQPLAGGVEPVPARENADQTIPPEADVDQSTEKVIVDEIAETIDQKEKQHVLDVLLPFYQEQAHQTMDHQVLQGLMKDKTNLLQEALNEGIYIEVFPDETEHKNEILTILYGDANYFEGTIGYVEGEELNASFTPQFFIQSLRTKINEVFDPQKKLKLQKFENKFSKNEEALHKYMKKINEKRIAIGKDILTLSEFSKWKNKDVTVFDNGLYSENGYSYIDTDRANEDQFLDFTRSKDANNSAEFMDLLSTAQKRLGITDDELKDFPQVATSEVQSILEEIRKTSSAPEPAEAQPSEDPYAVRGGKEVYGALVESYKELARLKKQEPYEKVVKKSKWGFKKELVLRDPQLLQQYQELMLKIAKEEYKAIKLSNHETVDFKEDEQKLREFMDISIIDISAERNDTYILEKLAVVLMRMNEVRMDLVNDAEMKNYDQSWEQAYKNKLTELGQVLYERLNKEGQPDFSKFYLNFDDQLKSVVATPATGVEVVDQAKPKTNREKFLESADEVTHSWDDKQKQTLAKLSDAVLFFQKRYLEQVLTNQPDMSDEDKTAFKIVVKNYAKTYAAQQYSDSRLDLPKKDKEAVIKLIPELFSQSD